MRVQGLGFAGVMREFMKFVVVRVFLWSFEKAVEAVYKGIAVTI